MTGRFAFQIKQLVNILLLALLFACGGGGNTPAPEPAPPAPPPPTAVFKVTVMDNATNRSPVAGVTVAIYNNDNKTIKSSVLTGNDGVADFGPQASDRLTVTVGYLKADNLRVIRTMMGVVTKEYELFTNDKTVSNGCITKDVSISVTGLPSAGTKTVLADFGYNVSRPYEDRFPYWQEDKDNLYIGSADESATTVNNATQSAKAVCPARYPGGIASVLVRSLGNNQGVVTRLVDIDLNAESPSAVVDFSTGAMQAASLNWSTSGFNTLRLRAYAVSDSAEYEIAQTGADYNSGGAASGSGWRVSSSVPAESYVIDAYSDTTLSTALVESTIHSENIKVTDMHERWTREGYAVVPDSVNLDYSNVVISAFTYTPALKSMSYKSSSSPLASYVNFKIRKGAKVEIGVQWDIMANVGTKEIVLMDLPSPMSDWLYTTDLNDLDNMNQANDLDYGVSVVNLDSVSSYDDFIANYMLSERMLDNVNAQQISSYAVYLWRVH